MKPIARCFLAALFALGSARAATYTVTSNADDGEGSLRQLIADAAAGDTINIPGGMAITLNTEINWGSKPLDIVGDPANMPVLAGNGSCRIFNFNRGNTPYRFRNLKFANYSFTGDGSAFYLDYIPNLTHISNCVFEAIATTGTAAIRGGNARNVLIEDCSFVNCTATEGYAAISSAYGPIAVKRCLFSGNSSPKNASCFSSNNYWVLTDCVFTHNVGVNGGAVAIGGSCETNGFVRCKFIQNYASGCGGAVWGRNKYFAQDCSFIGNSANDGGGAIFRYNGDVRLYNCNFSCNTNFCSSNYQEGGAFYNRNDSNSPTVVSNCVFRGNRALGKNSCSGAIGAMNGTKAPIDIIDCLFEDNFATNTAGAVELTTGGRIANCTFVGNGTVNNAPAAINLSPGNGNGIDMDIYNCTFYQNSSTGARGVIHINGSNATNANVRIRHCTFVGNTIEWGAVYGNSNNDPNISIEACVFSGNRNNAGTLVRDLSSAITTLNYCSFDQVESSGYTLYDSSASANNWFGGALGDLKLDGALAANGTEKTFLDGTHLPTLAIATSSPLRNKAPVTVATDARGVARGSVSNLAALGAYEYEPFVPTTVLIQ